MKRMIAAAALAATGLLATEAAACRYEGVRGYHNPSGAACQSAYRFDAHDLSRGRDVGIIFMSDRRTWFWRLSGQGDDLFYRLARVDPPTNSGLSGEMYPAPGDPVIRGSIRSGFCGEGYITLTRIPGSCDGDTASAPPPRVPTTGIPSPRGSQPGGDPGFDPRTQGGSLPVSGRSYGGNVRARPSVNAARVGSLGEGQRITVVEDTGVRMGDFHWFYIRWRGGEGYQWGGILCADTEVTRAFVCRN